MGVLNSKVIIKTSSQEDATAIPDDVIKGKIFYNKKRKADWNAEQTFFRKFESYLWF